MVHNIHKCGVRGDEISLTKVWRACKITQNHNSTDVYMYVVLAGDVIRVGLLVCGDVSAVSMEGGWCTHRSSWASVWTTTHVMRWPNYLLPAADVKWRLMTNITGCMQA